MTIRILLIEDNVSALTAATTALQDLGYEVDTARTPREMYNHLVAAEETNRPYDAFLSDYYLEFNGIRVHGSDTYEELRLSSPATTPIIAASSDIVMWEDLRTKKKDPHLHPIAKWDGKWNMPRVTAKLDELGLKP